jgi:DNA-binding NarL/FixJ family response regulator
MLGSLKIILVDDNFTFRNSLKLILIRQYNFQVIGEASNGEEFWKLKNIHQADIILMDIMMPGEDGINIAKKLLYLDNNKKIIAITMHNDQVYLTTLIEAGFMGCIFKNDIIISITPAIEAVMNGKRYYPQEIRI